MRRHAWIVGLALLICAGGTATAAPLNQDRQRFEELVRKRDLTDAEKRELARLHKGGDAEPTAPDLLPQVGVPAGDTATNTQRLERVTGRARRAVSSTSEQPPRKRADWRGAAGRAIRKAAP
jgi:hypothetical protein